MFGSVTMRRSFYLAGVALIALLALTIKSPPSALADNSERPAVQPSDARHGSLGFSSGPGDKVRTDFSENESVTVQEWLKRREQRPPVLMDASDYADGAETQKLRAGFLEDCRDHQFDSIEESWIPNVQLYCNHFDGVATQYNKKGLPIGRWTWRITFTGFAGTGSREVDFNVYLDEFTRFGVVPADPSVSVNLHCPFLVPDEIRWCDIDKGIVRRDISEWRDSPRVHYTVTSDAKFGESAEQVVLAQLSPQFITSFTGYLWKTPITETVRFDSASYLPQNKGAVFNSRMPAMVYDKANPNVKEVAAHIKTACAEPWKTYPEVSNKQVAGCSASNPLHRLRPKDSDAKRARYNKNNRIARKTCKAQWPGYSNRGQECDEFPFRSTYEGAAQHLYDPNAEPKQYSARPVTAADNQRAGQKLVSWYNASRILDWKSKSVVGVSNPFIVHAIDRASD